MLVSDGRDSKAVCFRIVHTSHEGDAVAQKLSKPPSPGMSVVQLNQGACPKAGLCRTSPARC